MNILPKEILRNIIILISCILGGFLLLTAVYALPVTKVSHYVMQSAPPMIAEGDKPRDYTSRPLGGAYIRDNYTDSIMLANAAFQSEHGAIYDAAQNSRFFIPGKENQAEHLLPTENDELQITSYPRYWHGYLIFLKPLLMLFSVQEIHLLNFYAQCAILVFLLLRLYREADKRKFVLPLFWILLLFFPLTVISKCIQFSTVFYPTFLSCIAIVLYHSYLEKKKLYTAGFMLLGIAIAYFDFLTYPIVSLGFALCFYLLYAACDWKKRCQQVLLYSFWWLFGYAGMWLSKWLLSSLILKQNIFLDAFQAVSFRTSNVYGTDVFSYFSVLQTNGGYPQVFFTLLIIIILAISLIIKYYRRQLTQYKTAALEYSPFLLVAALPFIWYFILSNHSYIHDWMTHRNYAVALLSLLFYLVAIKHSKDT